ncbi:hypothetical protein [Mongoliitalea daihaiensis]|uniref:hypothetical protein n=1 Tax=Mongoliitalea daihaiensis TaxID=2782006 RepID=UPI001F4453E6|nr:hypothetical protein [Mongoliitalea daihaiensis]UJP63977.1 hypothetical protein IPZ59_14255 [Mongoliitalea daihaiensis]
MTAIISYKSNNFGFTFPEACVEIEEISSRRNQNFFTEDGQFNTLVRLRVWATEQARTDGRQPIDIIERYANINEVEINSLHENVFESLFPTEQ